MKPRITAIVHTLNEERNLANALRSLAPWVDEIIVVDMHSEDRTVEIARSFGAQVFFFERQGSADPSRNFALEKATGDWIVALDADELIPHELSRLLLGVAENDRADICSIPRLNYFAGFPLLHTGWAPEQDRQDRFYRKGALAYSSAIHTSMRRKEGTRVLSLNYDPQLAIIHFNYLNISHCIQKLDRYTDIEALQRNREGKHMRAADILLRPLREFLNRYFRRQGFRDGWPGLYYALLMAFYRLTQAMKLRESYLAGSIENVREKYQTIADQYLGEYESSSKPR